MITPTTGQAPDCFKTVTVRDFEVMYTSGPKSFTLVPDDVLEDLDWEWRVTIKETGEIVTLSKKNYDWSSLLTREHRVRVDLRVALSEAARTGRDI